MKKALFVVISIFLLAVSVFATDEDYYARRIGDNPYYTQPDGFEKQVGVKQSPLFMFVYGADLKLDGEYLRPGDTVRAYSPDKTFCGARQFEYFIHTFMNTLRYMPIYHADIYEQPIVGPYPGDTISFTINSIPVASDPVIVWTKFGDRVRINGFKTINCCVYYGDWNKDLVVDNIDLALLVDYLFFKGPLPECAKSGDFNADGSIDNVDLAAIIDYLYRGEGSVKECKEK